MSNTVILNILKELKPVLREKYGIEKMAVFGSVAKGKYDKNSDIDIAILKMRENNFFLMIEAKYFLQKIFDRNIDIGIFDKMKTLVKNRIKEDFVYV